MKRSPESGLSLLEVLVALGLVATALMAGLQAHGAWTRESQRQELQWLAQLCADNTLTRWHLGSTLPDLGEQEEDCPQAGRTFRVLTQVQGTPNPLFRRLDVQVRWQGQNLLTVSSVLGH